MGASDHTPDPGEPAEASSGRYILLGADGRPHPSSTPGRFGGHRKNKIYGRMGCRAALRAIATGGYLTHQVFFADEPTAVAAGYRPCAVCMPEGSQTGKTR